MQQTTLEATPVLTLLEGAAISATYEDCRDLTLAIIGRFVRLHGGDWDEYESASNEIFLKAYYGYAEKKSAFETWYRLKLWLGFQEVLRRNISRHNRAPTYQIGERDIPARPAPCDRLGVFLRDLSDDARLVAEFALDGPIDVRLAVAQRGEGSPTNIREAICEVLMDMGWKKSRVRKAFEEITESLAG